MFFFAKENQKTLGCAVVNLSGERPTGNNSFLLLFFKKEGLA
jgi:hypothetical protein